MRREILFRGKRIDNGAWETGGLVVIRAGCSDEQCYIADKMTGYLTPVCPATIGQYTGLTDCNGKRIFEGDVVHICDALLQYSQPYYEFDGYVDFSNGAFRIVGTDGMLHYRWIDYDVTITGNIHNTPPELEA